MAQELEFTVTVSHACENNTFTLALNQTDQKYTIGSSSATTAITIPKSTVTGASANTNCVLEYTTEIFDEILNEWKTLTAALVTSTYTWIKSGTLGDATTTNTFQVWTTNKSLAYNKHYLRQKITDAQVATSSVLYDHFHVEIDYYCRDD